MNALCDSVHCLWPKWRPKLRPLYRFLHGCASAGSSGSFRNARFSATRRERESAARNPLQAVGCAPQTKPQNHVLGRNKIIIIIRIINVKSGKETETSKPEDSKDVSAESQQSSRERFSLFSTQHRGKVPFTVSHKLASFFFFLYVNDDESGARGRGFPP